MKTHKRIGPGGQLVWVTEMSRQHKRDPQYYAAALKGPLRALDTFGYGDSIEEAVDAACGV